MNLFERCELYLLKNNIELTDDDRIMDNRIGISEEKIYKWKFPIPQPTIQELNDQLDSKTIDKLRKKQKQKAKLKNIMNYPLPVLNDEEMLSITELSDCLFIKEETGDLYLYYNKQLRKVHIE